LQLGFVESFKECLKCDDKNVDGECITNCTKRLVELRLQIFHLERRFSECLSDEKCEKRILGEFQSFLQDKS
jgi:hypothetical protein